MFNRPDKSHRSWFYSLFSPGLTPLPCMAELRQCKSSSSRGQLIVPAGETPIQPTQQSSLLLILQLICCRPHTAALRCPPWQSCRSGGFDQAGGSSQCLCLHTTSFTASDSMAFPTAGRTPLHYAALHGRAAAVEELIKQGAAHGASDHRGGYTPLHLAADAGQCEVISRLAELGADLEAVSSKGWTPLALANMKVSCLLCLLSQETVDVCSLFLVGVSISQHIWKQSAARSIHHWPWQTSRSVASCICVSQELVDGCSLFSGGVPISQHIWKHSAARSGHY